MQNISKCTIPGCFPGVPRHNFLYLSFTLLKIPTAFAKLATLIQNISKCTFPWCFPGISWVFPGCFPGVPEHFFCTLLLLLKLIPTTFVKEVFILKHASLIQNLSKCSFPGCFPGDSWQIEFLLISSILCGTIFFMI